MDMDYSDPPQARPSREWLPLGLLSGAAVFSADLWGGDAATSRSRDLTPLYAQRFVGARGAAILGSHPFWEISFVFRGTGSMLGAAPADEVPMRPGTAVVIPPGVAHREASSVPMDTLWIGLRGKRVSALKDRRMSALHSAVLSGICEQLWLCGRTGRTGCGPELDGFAMVLFAKLMRLRQGDERSVPRSEMLDDAIRYMQQHLGEPIGVAALAERFGCSEGHFHRTFRSKTGLTPVQFLTRLRIETAQQLMRESRMPIARIAALVGYADPLYFSRVFRKATGRSPSGARSNERGVRATPGQDD